MSGPLDEQEITFASTVADGTLVEEKSEDEEEMRPTVHGLQWVDVQPSHSAAAAGASAPPPDVRPKTTMRNVDSATRKRQQKEMTDRTKRLYSQLEEVKERKAYKAREERKIDVQARRKDYSAQLQARARKS